MAAEIVICSLPPRTQDLTGKRFGNWTVLAFSHIKVYTNNHNRQRLWACRCDCGKHAAVLHFELVKDLSKSCGCRRTGCSSTHGMSVGEETRSPIYGIWVGLRSRCRRNKHYTQRGIIFDERWKYFKNFHDDMMPTWKEGLSLDRIDNDGPYSKENCRWADRYTQMNNRRNCVLIEFNGESLTISQWARKLGIHSCTLSSRIEKGWPKEKIFTNGTFTRASSKAFSGSDVSGDNRQFNLSEREQVNKLLSAGLLVAHHCESSTSNLQCDDANRITAIRRFIDLANLITKQQKESMITSPASTNLFDLPE